MQCKLAQYLLLSAIFIQLQHICNMHAYSILYILQLVCYICTLRCMFHSIVLLFGVPPSCPTPNCPKKVNLTAGQNRQQNNSKRSKMKPLPTNPPICPKRPPFCPKRVYVPALEVKVCTLYIILLFNKYTAILSLANDNGCFCIKKLYY